MSRQRVNIGRRAVPGLAATRGRRVLTDVDGCRRCSSWAVAPARVGALPGVRPESIPAVPVAPRPVGPCWRMLVRVGWLACARDQHRHQAVPRCWRMLLGVGSRRTNIAGGRAVPITETLAQRLGMRVSSVDRLILRQAHPSTGSFFNSLILRQAHPSTGSSFDRLILRQAQDERKANWKSPHPEPVEGWGLHCSFLDFD